MKKIISIPFLAAALLLTPALLQSQSPLKKLYAYKQASVSGVKPGVSDKATKQSETYNYWFYLVFPKDEELSVTEIWLSGKKFLVKTEIINELPVKKTDYTDPSGNKSVTMVPFSKNAVILTYPSSEVTEVVTNSKYFSDLISRYELVITYYWKGKKFYKVARKITMLEPETHL